MRIIESTNANIFVYLEQKFDDAGYYITTDGNIVQENAKCNFTYTIEDNVVSIFNSVDKDSFYQLREATYKINWGDETNDDILIGETISHTYSDAGKYELEITLESPWSDSLRRKINVGEDIIIENPLGTLTISSPYSDSEFEQNYITLADAECQQLQQEGVIVSGFTQSRLSELLSYGETEIGEGLDSSGNGIVVGGKTEESTTYIIDNVLYIDFPDGLTYYQLDVGENPLEVTCQLLTKEEAMMGVVQDLEIQSDVFVDRGTTSVFENNLRLCDLDSVGEAEYYGNKYFTIRKTV